MPKAAPSKKATPSKTTKGGGRAQVKKEEKYKPKVLYFDATDEGGNVDVKPELLDRVCIICNGALALRSVRNDYFYFGRVENYVDLMNTCYGIKFSIAENDKVDAICSGCVDRLRSAVEFRKEAEQAHKRFTLYMSKGQPSQKTEIKKPVKQLNTPKQISASLLKNLKAQQVNLGKMKTTPQLSSKQMLANKPKDLVITKKVVKRDGDKQEVIVLDDSDDGMKQDIDGGGGFDYGDDHFDTNYNSDDNWSVTSKEMDRATGHPQKIVQHKFVIPDLDLNLTQCPVCSIQYLDYAALASHYYKHYPQSLCHICGYRSMNTSINSHLESHSDVRYPCTLCERTFKACHSLNQHVKSFHNKDKLYKCTKCDEKFSSSLPRRKHMMTEHGFKFNMLQCSACEKTFFAQFQLKKHYDSFHLKKKNVFCSYCGDGFFNNSSLKNHLLKHTGGSSHKCEYCGKTFTRKKSLLQHIKIHLNIRNFKCEHCDKTFVQKCALKGHLKTHGFDYNNIIDKTL